MKNKFEEFLQRFYESWDEHIKKQEALTGKTNKNESILVSNAKEYLETYFDGVVTKKNINLKSINDFESEITKLYILYYIFERFNEEVLDPNYDVLNKKTNLFLALKKFMLDEIGINFNYKGELKIEIYNGSYDRNSSDPYKKRDIRHYSTHSIKKSDALLNYLSEQIENSGILNGEINFPDNLFNIEYWHNKRYPDLKKADSNLLFSNSIFYKIILGLVIAIVVSMLLDNLFSVKKTNEPSNALAPASADCPAADINCK